MSGKLNIFIIILVTFTSFACSGGGGGGGGSTAIQDMVFPSSFTAGGGDSVAISSSEEVSNQVWFAPAGLTVDTEFIAGPTMTQAVDGLATSINAPANEGTYYLYIIQDGDVSPESVATLTVDNTAPANQDSVYTADETMQGGDTVIIASSGDESNEVWFGPAGLADVSEFSEGATMTKASSGTSTTIIAPADEGVYYLYIIDEAGNVSSPSTASLTIDNSAPTNQNAVFAGDYVSIGGEAVTIVSSGDATNEVWFAPSGTTVFSAGSTMTQAASGTSTSILAPGDEGAYRLYVIDAAGNISNESAAVLTVDNTAPTNQDSVFASGVEKQGGESVTIVSSGQSTNEVWFAPSGTTVFSAGSTMTQAASGTSTSILAPGDEGAYRLYVIDAAGNISNESAAVLTVDNTAPTVSIGLSTESYATSSDTVDYAITYTDADIINLTTGEVVVNTTGTASCTETVLNGTTATPTVRLTGCTGDGSVDIEISGGASSDNAGNTDTGDSTSTSFIVDNTIPVISSVSPSSSSGVNNTLVSYTFSEICDTGSVTWTRTGGSPDINHEQSLTGSELNAGAHENITLTNNPALVDGSVYTISFACTDRAGHIATTVSSTNVTFTDSALEVVNAVTMDTNGNGKIDTYKVSFNKSVNDSTFPGYSENSLGSVTSEWLVAGYANVRMIHGSAVTFATDTANDAIIYIRFDENLIDCNASNQSGCDTGAKPDLSTSASPGLEDIASNTIAQVDTGDVTEADGSEPILVTATSLNATQVKVVFSEHMEETTAETHSYYTLTGSVNVSGAVRQADYKVVYLTTGTQVGGTNYTLTVNTDVKDLANFNLSAAANTASFDGNVKPVVENITTVDSTTLLLTFNESIVASSVECTSLTTCDDIYQNSALPVKSSVSTAGQGNNSTTYYLTVNLMVEGQNYSTSVLENTAESVASGQKMGNVNNSATFNGDGNPGVYVHPDTEAECPSNTYGSGVLTTVIVEFDQAVTDSATTGSNYTISMCVTGDCDNGSGSPNDSGALSVTHIDGNKYAVHFSETFDSDESRYRLSINNVEDSSGNTVNSPSNFEFRCGTDQTPPSLIRANVISANGTATQVMLNFSESLGQVEANISGNYKYDSESYGEDVSTAALQSNPSQVLVTYAPGLSDGGHQVRVQNVKDLAATPNTILDNGVNNVQPIIVNAPDSLGEGEVFDDPFQDGTRAAYIVKYSGLLYMGSDESAAKLFEVDYGLTTSQTITMDADGTAGEPYSPFFNYASTNSGTVKGVDTLYAACIGGTSTPEMTGTECIAEGGVEKLFVGSLNITGNYISYWETSDKSSSTTTFTFTEGLNPDPGGGLCIQVNCFCCVQGLSVEPFRGRSRRRGPRGTYLCE